MQVILVTLGSIGDLMPFLVVAEKLRARGHSCIIASNAGYAQLVQASGFPFAAIWDRGTQSLDEALARDPDRAWQLVREQMFEPAAEPTLRCIAHYAKAAPTVVLASWSAFGARAAHANWACHWSAPIWRRMRCLCRMQQTIPGIRIGLFPDWFADANVPRLGFPLHDDALIPPLPPELETFLQDGDTPVVMTPGSSCATPALFSGQGSRHANSAACARCC